MKTWIFLEIDGRYDGEILYSRKFVYSRSLNESEKTWKFKTKSLKEVKQKLLRANIKKNRGLCWNTAGQWFLHSFTYINKIKSQKWATRKTKRASVSTNMLSQAWCTRVREHIVHLEVSVPCTVDCVGDTA